MLRLFIAIEMPPAWIDALAAVQDQLRRRGLERLRWVRPEGIHLTLAFLGDVAEQRVPDVTNAMTEAAVGRQPFRLALGDPGTFGGPAGPRVLWVGIDGDLGPLNLLQRTVAARVRAAGFPIEGGRFAPHLTLARVPDRLPADMAGRIGSALAGVSVPAAAPFTVSTVALMRSELGPGGARYTRLGAAALAHDRGKEGTKP
jgi:2'-5' RNA ligase